MATYRVVRRSDGAEVYRYAAEEPVEWVGFEFAAHEHLVVPDAPPPDVPHEDPADWHVYPGPFKDRLGVDALAIAASTHPVCIAAREMLAGRVYIDLKGAKTAALLDMLIATGQPAASPYFPGSGPMTAEKKAAIMGPKATPEERYRG